MATRFPPNGAKHAEECVRLSHEEAPHERGSRRGDIHRIAPEGTVNAGVRVSGNLMLAVGFVSNADNIQVCGKIIGVPSAKKLPRRRKRHHGSPGA